MVMPEKFQKLVPCLGCGHSHALLKEITALYRGTHKVLVRCTVCNLDFTATFNEKEWAKLTNGGA